MEVLDYTRDPRAILIHYNQNHDQNTGRFVSDEVTALSTRIYKSAMNRVDNIESDVTTAATKSGSKLYGLQHKQKTLDSIMRKIQTDSNEKGISPKQAAEDIKDAIRFTTVSKDGDFVRNYREFKYYMGQMGYEELKCKNYWNLYHEGKAKHKQVTSVFGDHTGYRFEVQFQTPSSLEAKEKKTKLYEEVRQEGVDPARKSEIIREMERLASTVNDPDDIYEIKNHG